MQKCNRVASQRGAGDHLRPHERQLGSEEQALIDKKGTEKNNVELCVCSCVHVCVHVSVWCACVWCLCKSVWGVYGECVCVYMCAWVCICMVCMHVHVYDCGVYVCVHICMSVCV